MKIITDSLAHVINQASFVSLNQAAIETYVGQLLENPPKKTVFEDALFTDAKNDEEAIAFAFISSELNFCFWGDPKWGVEVDGTFMSGSVSLMYCLKRAIKEGFDLFNPRYLADITREDVKVILRGSDTEIPLLNERVEILRHVGKVVCEMFSGSFGEIVNQADWDAEKLVELVVKKFPKAFDDSEDYAGQTVHFYKRVQLIPIQLFDLYNAGKLGVQMKSMEKLSGLADYKIPQMLRKHGMIEYVSSLAEKVDSMTELTPGSREEIEIRAFTIMAIEKAAAYGALIGLGLSAVQINDVLWLSSQDKSKSEKPYHLIRTIWY